MHKTRATIAFGAALVSGLSLALSGVAHADSAARPGDIVGVGSDTIQNMADFVFDSSPGNSGGYNELGNKNRVDNVFATGDANGRAVYDGNCGAKGTNGLPALCSATNAGAPNPLPGSVVLRDGTDPVLRPNGSGAGAAALNLDAPGGAGYEGLPLGSIQFARMSRLPNATEEGNCTTSSACKGLDVYQVATDSQRIAVQSTTFGGTNAPTALSDAQLIDIYTCQGAGPNGAETWASLPGAAAGASTDNVDALIPQSGSGTRNFFLAELTAANNNVAVNPGACVRTVQEHDPSAIYSAPNPKDSIEPFSVAKLGLINGTNAGLSGPYFQNGAGYSGTVNAVSTPDGAYTPGYLTTLTGATASDGKAGYDVATQPVYIVIRKADESSQTPIQPGASQNWAQFLFTGGTIANPSSTAAQPYIESGAAQVEMTEAGLTSAYKSCGLNPATC